jgi:hypothetical protein
MGEEDSRLQSQTRLEMFNANTAGMVTRRLNLTKLALISPDCPAFTQPPKRPWRSLRPWCEEMYLHEDPSCDVSVNSMNAQSFDLEPGISLQHQPAGCGY